MREFVNHFSKLNKSLNGNEQWIMAFFHWTSITRIHMLKTHQFFQEAQ